MNRQEMLDSLRQNPEVTVLIIGAGINGIGTFRDLALQGVDVLIVEKGDFCSGASAASSHMVHGGVRYLENGEFRLVREAVRERNLLLQNAPHIVKPLPTVIPIFKWFSGFFNAPLKFFGLLDRPSERGALVIKIGLMLYDAYTRAQGTLPRHRFSFKEKSLKQFPMLNADILCTATYFDAMMPSPERLALELLMDAEGKTQQARAVNYMRVIGAAGKTITLRDEVTNESLEVKPNIVINAAGPWIDFANQAMGQKTHFIGGTKGSHLILDHPELREAIGENEFFFENDDGRIVLIFPLNDKVLIGTSDLHIDNPDQAQCTDEEVEYFFAMLKRVFPSIQVERKQIVFRFSGVRPLPKSDASSSGQISRDHSVRVIEPGNGIDFPVHCLIGGKWTTFRSFSEQVTDVTLENLGKSRRLSTENLPVGGGKDFPLTKVAKKHWLANLREQTSLPQKRIEALFERYGTRADLIAKFISESEDDDLSHKPDYSRREVSFLALHEKIIHLDDLLLRRSDIAISGEVTGNLIDELAEVVGSTLGWSSDKRKNEVLRTINILADQHRVPVPNRA